MASSKAPQNFGYEHLWLLPLFIGSGCTALIYEIVWFQSLQMVVGASAVISVDLSEYTKAEAGATCLSLLI